MTHQDDTHTEFDEAVNMSGSELRRWLETEESRSVGQKDGDQKDGDQKDGDQKDGDQTDGGESTGHEMGRHIIELKDKKRDQLTDNDDKRMRKVIGYVHRHLAQRPHGDVHDSRWRYSLMNWGHDPEK